MRSMLSVLLLAVACIESSADEILGPTRSPILLPDAGEFVRGMTAELEVGREALAGYVPVKITLKSTGRFPADRRFVFRFQSEPQMESPPQNGLVVDVPLKVNEGAAKETFVRYLPKWSAGQAVSVVVSEDGRPLEGYAAFYGGDHTRPTVRSGFQRGAAPRRHVINSEYRTNWVFISEHDHASSRTMPDTADVFLSEPASFKSVEGTLTSAQKRVGFWDFALANYDVCAIGQQELPLDWRAYQRYDVIAMSQEGLQRLAESDDAFSTVRDWVLNGGTVVVYNSASVVEVLEKLAFTHVNDSKFAESLTSISYDLANYWQQERSLTRSAVRQYQDGVLQMSRQIAALANPEDKRDTPGEIVVPEESTGLSMSMSFESDARGFSGRNVTDPALMNNRLQELIEERDRQQTRLAELDQALGTTAKQWAEQVQIEGAGAGYVIAIQQVPGRDSPTEAHWQIMNRLIEHRASPTLRRGVDSLIGDRRFRRWTIPGVAQPPVYTFMGLLTAFVILVGPVAYRRTSKLGRSYLMFAIAPVLALLTTVAMFGYGIISDGFGTMVRVRQLTWVDGKSGDAGERVRSTYFAGVRPTEGLHFPGDAELMVYREGTGQSWEDLDGLTPAMLGQVMVDENVQHLNASFLPSRQQCQFVTHRPRRDVGYVQLMRDPKGISAPQVESGFAFPLKQAVLRDDQSTYWLVENLGPGEVKPTEPLTTRDASRLLGKLYNDHRPLAEVRESRSTSTRYDDEIYDVIMEINRALGVSVAITDGFFEYWLQQNLQTNGEIPKQHFVAITDISQDVLAVDNCDVKSSIRYVFGTLR